MSEEDILRASRALTRRQALRGALAAGAAVSLPALLAACGSEDDGGGSGQTGGEEGPTARGRPVRGGKLRVGHVGGGKTEDLNPLFLPSFMAVARAHQMYEQLFFKTPQLGEVEPRLAESVEPNKDATVWRLKLRSGITWHDGKPFRADDVLYTWKWILEPKNGAEGLPTLEPFDLKRTRKVSDTEIELHLKRPIGSLDQLLGEKPLYIVQEDANFDKPVGTGPFRFGSFDAGDRTLLTRNDEYWGEGPYFDEVELIAIPDNTARLNALLGGQIDALDQMDYTQAKAQQENAAIELVISEAPNALPFTMRLDTAPFDDPRVVEAVKLSMDRQELVDKVVLGFGEVGNDLFGKGYTSYNDDLPQREYDPERAKALLAEAGKENLRVTLHTSAAVPGLVEAATVFKEQAKASGIQVDLKRVQPEAYFDPEQTYLSKSAPFYQSTWQAAFEQQAADGLLTNAPYNETAWNDPAWEKRFRTAQGIADADERNAAYKELQVDLHERGGYAIWGFGHLIDAVSKKVKGVEPNPGFDLGYYQFKDYWFES